MVRVRLSRLRTGATQWGLFRDGELPHDFVELFVVARWNEHLRQHTDRLTGTDEEFLDAARALSDPAPRTWHTAIQRPVSVASCTDAGRPTRQRRRTPSIRHAQS